jgi:phage replication-related protein YjqB (UPF0714/DUF867 family)
MSFGGHHAKKASDQLQKKLQEEAMADELADNMAGMDVKDNDNMSIGSSNTASQLEIMIAQNRHLQNQLKVMQMTTTTLTQ